MKFQNDGTEPIFEAKGISYSYNDQIVALEHIDLIVHPHEIGRID